MGRRKKVGRLVFVSVCVCVQAFPGIAPERLVRSGPGWHRWTPRNAGTTMVPVGGRSAARGSWHVPPRESLQKNRTHLQVKRRAPPIPNSQVIRIPPRRNAGTTMVPVGGRSAARGSWHVPPRESLQKKSHAPTGQTEGTADPKLAGHTYTTPT